MTATRRNPKTNPRRSPRENPQMAKIKRRRELKSKVQARDVGGRRDFASRVCCFRWGKQSDKEVQARDVGGRRDFASQVCCLRWGKQGDKE